MYMNSKWQIFSDSYAHMISNNMIWSMVFNATFNKYFSYIVAVQKYGIMSLRYIIHVHTINEPYCDEQS
jgi:hypothetical protein